MFFKESLKTKTCNVLKGQIWYLKFLIPSHFLFQAYFKVLVIRFCNGKVQLIDILKELQKTPYMGRLMRLWYFLSTINSFFKRACAAIQWG